MGFEPTTFCMASRSCGTRFAGIFLQIDGFALMGVALRLPGIHREITEVCAPNVYPGGWAPRRTRRQTGQSLAAGHADIVITRRRLELRRQS
jgi:hypothetical protein